MVPPAGSRRLDRLHEPSLELLRRLQAEFGLHELAIEDALKAHQRPKLEQYGDALFVGPHGPDAGRPHRLRRDALFVGRGYVVSVRHGASTSYTPVRERCEASSKALSDGEDFILYAILDFIVDNYMPVIEAIHEEVDEIEDSILDATSPQDQVGRLYQRRRDLLRLRNAAVPLVEVCRRLEQPGLPGIDVAMQPLFRDVSDHIRRSRRRSSRSARSWFRLRDQPHEGQAQQTEVSRRLAAWAAILAVLTAAAGIYGMNRAHAGAGMALRLFPGARRHRRRLRRALLALPEVRLAVRGLCRQRWPRAMTLSSFLGARSASRGISGRGVRPAPDPRVTLRLPDDDGWGWRSSDDGGRDVASLDGGRTTSANTANLPGSVRLGPGHRR